MHRVIAALVLCLLPNIAVAATAENLAVYSDVCINKDSGDLNGMRVAVLRLGGMPYLVLQWASADTFEDTEIEKLSPDDLGKGKINFSYEYQKAPTLFTGRITEKAIIGAFNNKSLMQDYGHKTIQLRRVPASQKRFGVCR